MVQSRRLLARKKQREGLALTTLHQATWRSAYLLLSKTADASRVLATNPTRATYLPDMRYVGFLLLTAHLSSKWMDPTFSPQREKVVVVYSEEVLQGSASVLLRPSLPPHDAEGAICVRRRLRLRYLIRQLDISPEQSWTSLLPFVMMFSGTSKSLLGVVEVSTRSASNPIAQLHHGWKILM